MKRIFATVLLLLILIAAGAHEFWLQPEKFFFRSGEKLVVSFKVGENFMGEPRDLKKHRIEKLELYQL
jgi:uncharacterized GH25 family protein